MQSIKIAVVGLGYVGLPLAIEFGKKYNTLGVDISDEKIKALRSNIDPAGEVETEEFIASTNLNFSSNPSDLSDADVIIIAVPTPVDKAHTPDFEYLIGASETVGSNMKKGAIVVYESTVYPGATEEICIPVLEDVSSMIWKKDFHVGYSPERVNPGDKVNTITKIIKVVTGDNEKTADLLCDLYGSIIEAGIHRASSIKVAEASKVIENTQRDLNIALMNELAIVFDKIGIDTLEVLQAAGSKWNFLPFRPGLVGGHCIGVDPYYLTYKAEKLGYNPQVILAGRRINDGIASYLAKMTVQHMIKQGGCSPNDKVLVLGLAFKENCSDVRNSKVADLVDSLKAFALDVVVHDPIVDVDEAKHEYGLDLVSWDNLSNDFGAIVVAVSHDEYKQLPLSDILQLLKPNGVFIDVKSGFDAKEIEAAGHFVWRL